MQPFVFAEDGVTNFGDDLNRWLWQRFLPDQVADPQDGVLLCGIGTVLTAELLPPAKHYVVLGSGVGYSAAPSDFGGPKWSVVCVRGPLTARVLGLPASKAVGDGAILLGSLPELRPVEEAQRSGVVFMPHFQNLPSGDWAQICQRAGVELLDPRLPSEQVIARIRTAKLVLADAMHAAIVADAVRVPWVPLTLSTRINTFKWLDWSLSLSLPYRPIAIPSPTLLEAIRDSARGLYGRRHAVAQKTEAAAIRDFEQSRRLKSHRLWPAYSRRAYRLAYWGPNRVLRAPVLSSSIAADTAKRMDLCAAALSAAAKSTSYLSDDAVFYGKVEALIEKTEEVKRLKLA